MNTAKNPEIELLSEPAPFNMSDEWYQYATLDHFWIQWRFTMIQRLLQSLDLGERLLEIGCGHGLFRSQLETHYQTPVDGCDLNLAALQSAPQGDGKLYLYNVHDRRPEWEQFFDSAFLLDTLEHIDDAVGFLKSVRFHLSDHGLLVINVPAVQMLYSRYDSAVGHVKRYSRRCLAEELEAAGMRLLSFSYWGATLLPIAAARKALVRLIKSRDIVSCGINPPSKLSASALRLLMRIETRLLQRPKWGTSLAAVAQRVD